MTLPDEAWRIDTPENVAFDYAVAGIGSRFLAAIVDSLLILVLQAVVNVTMLLLAGLLGASSAGMGTGPLGWLFAVLGLVSFVLLWGYYVFFEILWNGQSPGKRWVGLRVIRIDGTPITASESVIRNLVRLVDFLPVYYGIGVVTMFVNDRARRLGDLAAGTIVVRDRGPVTLESLDAGKALSRLSNRSRAASLDLPVERLTDGDLQMAEEYLRRRSDLMNRSEIAVRIKQTLLGRMGVPAGQVPPIAADDLIEQIVEASRARQAD
jgi:uncharacterized RDD family membrane protein YckC